MNMWPSVSLLIGAVTMLTAVSPVQAADDNVIGECRTATQSAGTEIWPITNADSYLVNYRGEDPRYKKFDFDSEGTKVTLIKAPKHGKVGLADVPDVSNDQYLYMPEKDYVGRDHFVIEVEKDGTSVRIEYLIENVADDQPTTNIGDDGERQGIYCQPDQWKISAIIPTRHSTNLQALTNVAGDNNIFSDISNAAGNGWQIDYMPYLNNKHMPSSADRHILKSGTSFTKSNIALKKFCDSTVHV